MRLRHDDSAVGRGGAGGVLEFPSATAEDARRRRARTA